MKKDNKYVGIIICLFAVILVLTGYIIYDKISYKDLNNNLNQDVQNGNLDNEIGNNETNEDNNSNNKNYVDKISDDKEIANIMLNNKILKVEVIKDSLYIDDKLLLSLYDSMEDIGDIYVIKNEVVLVLTYGGDVRSEGYYFYNSDLEKIDVDMTLDNEYPTSMGSKYFLGVENNTIIIEGTRLTHGPELVLEEKDRTEAYDYSMPLCAYDYDTDNSVLNKDTYNLHKGEILSAKYEMKYLGNGKFSKFKRVEILNTLDENYCNR